MPGRAAEGASTIMSRSTAFIITGTQSGCGKTTLTLGLLAALQQKGLKVQPFKSGPDFIDPTLHRLVTGRVSRNLDPWMCGAEYTRQLFTAKMEAADISLVEGAMGMFDGGESSSAALAKLLQIPVVLVVDARSTAESMAAVVKGFEILDPEVRVRAVILNRVGSPRHLELLRGAIEKHCQAEIVGHLPRDVQFSIPERHLGLHMGDEDPISRESLLMLAETVSEFIDLDRLVEISKVPAKHSQVAVTGVNTSNSPVRIAVARDKAFCFYYQDNFDLLERAGAELLYFSPVDDRQLPENIQGIYLGGGYPELYLPELAANNSLLAAIREWSAKGGAIYAECGGFMYLTEGITDRAGKFHPMAAVFPVKSHMKKGRVSLGYREALLRENFLLGEAGQRVRGHEFHYSDIDPMPEHVDRIYQLNDQRMEGYAIANTLGSYLHLHFGYNHEIANYFIHFCRETP